ncbi:unnamed protein product [Alopecurus aequalis]
MTAAGFSPSRGGGPLPMAAARGESASRVSKEEEEIEAEGFATMKEETAGLLDLSDFEFFTIILGNSWDRLRLPDKFARLLDGQEPREVTLREAGGGPRMWDVEVVFDGKGHMYLDRGWEQFARVHDLELGNFLVFSYDGNAVLTVKVFDMTMCRRHYHPDDATTGTGSSSDNVSKNSSDSVSYNSIDSGSNGTSWAEMEIDDSPTSQFTVTLKTSNLGARQQQYLNVPPEFQDAHGYEKRTKVELRMRGKSWPVSLKHNIRAGPKIRTSLRYGWHQFCVDNGLGVGDVCFFQALRGRGEEHALKVEVRKPDGTFLD